jgi:hypothetical protein
MKSSLILFFILFAINNLLHYISEKVIIVIFILFIFFLMRFLSSVINAEFKEKVDYILNDINMYINVVFNFLYINKLFYLNLKFLRNNFLTLTSILYKRLKNTKITSLLNNKLNNSAYNSISLFK